MTRADQVVTALLW